MAISAFPANPAYGTGVFRRAVRLTNRPGEVFGELEDTMHALRCTIRHNNERIVAVIPEFTRLPMDTCFGAGLPLQALVGLPLATPQSWFYAEGRPRQNCTHLYDLAWWMIAHAARQESIRDYQIVIPDMADGRSGSATLMRDRRPILEWVIRDGFIVGPKLFAGREILRGFAGWAMATLEGDVLEAALLLQKGYFVSRSRRSVPPPGPIADQEIATKGVCWTFSSPRFDVAIRGSSQRDFSDDRDLLRFR